jgi:hypothetical protein
MPRKPDPAVELEEEEVETEDVPLGDPRQADTPFDPWGEEEEESDRRRDPLRSPV